MTTDDTRAEDVSEEAAAPETTTPKATPAKKAKSTKAKAPRRAKGPTDVEFRFTGDPARGMSDIPARDLTQADVDRITYRRTIPEPGTRGLRRGEAGFSQARAKVVRDLTATGKFTKRS